MPSEVSQSTQATQAQASVFSSQLLSQILAVGSLFTNRALNPDGQEEEKKSSQYDDDEDDDLTP